MDANIFKALSNAGIEEYRITETKTESLEAFFVKHRLDLKRMKESTATEVTVYNVFEDEGVKMRGSAEVYVFPGMTEEELTAKFKDAYIAAGFVKNKYYDIAAREKDSEIKELPSLEESLGIMSRALFEADKDEAAFINSAEIFIEKKLVRILNSFGSDVSYNRFVAKGEFVCQCKEPQDVETYMDFAYQTADANALQKLVSDTLLTTRARAMATEAPKAGNYRVIISGRYLAEIFNFYIARTSGPFLYAKYTDYKPGDSIQGEDIKGDSINVTLKALSPFSSEGIRMKDMKLIEDGKLLGIHSSEKYAYYLGTEPTGSFDSMEVGKGSISFEDMKKAPYLNVVNFSDFQVEELNGSFGGEIRLAFLFDGEKTIPVTGGSVNGNLFDLQGNMHISSETQKQLHYEGPYAICFDNVNVAGK
jgi:predicted Zn-dependent protease